MKASELAEERFPATLAMIGLGARAGAKDFEFGYLDDAPHSEDARWWASCNWRGVKVFVDEHIGPEEACDALAAKLIEGGTCGKCGKAVTVYPESRQVRRASCVWTRVDTTWCAGCDPAPEQNQAYGDRPYNDMRANP